MEFPGKRYVLFSFSFSSVFHCSLLVYHITSRIFTAAVKLLSNLPVALKLCATVGDRITPNPNPNRGSTAAVPVTL